VCPKHLYTWLRPVESLNLTLLVGTQHQELVGRIEIEPNNILQLLDEVFVAADLEGFDQVGLQVVLFP
jgi:hypothetical protein